MHNKQYADGTTTVTLASYPESAGVEYCCRIIPTAWGQMAIVARMSPEVALTELVLPSTKSKVMAQMEQNPYRPAPNNELLPRLTRMLIDYFQGKRVYFTGRVDVSWASDFTQAVLRSCGAIPSGQTLSYGQIARHLRQPHSARAVGTALGRNRIPIIIPCHRVICSNGLPGGYSAPQGVTFKKRLLNHEKA